MKLKRIKKKRLKCLYQWLTWQPDLEASVRLLNKRSLRGLNGWLGRKNIPSGIPALIHGLILAEAARRTMKRKEK